MKKSSFILKSVLGIFLFGILVMAIRPEAIPSPVETQAANIREKHIISVPVEREDTLWDLAKQYYTEECGTMKEYIAEIKQCNALDNDTIYAGYSLVIPVWYSDQEAAFRE